MTPLKPDHAILQQAAHWYAELSAEAADEGTRAAWLQWHGQSEMHRQAWLYVERISQRFAPLQGDGELTLQTLKGARRAQQSRRQALRTLAVLCGGSLLGWAGWRGTPLPGLVASWRADYRSATGEVREFTLDDGSRVWLNSASALGVDLQADLRLLRLVAGEVLIDTHHDSRPFVITTAEGRLRALGTRFSVQQQEGRTRLNVFEGAVEVRNASGELRVAQAGEQLAFDAQAIGTLQPASQGRQSWSQGILLASDMPLSAFVEELASHRHGHLGVAPSVAHLRVTGTFPLHDGDQALAMLEDVLPIRIRRTLPWWQSVEAR
ncbi:MULTISPECIES: FecR domain-containing protein [unclassified Pseudomonas]|uniref:FecR domain-containing protein n=1 Tax=unclassified Pseudomonas TaxID=196821 RepID=UPI001BF1026D|nr:FecR domain-containing protein [Pseudomonas sp. Pc102]BBP85136.1 protein FecR [Pseudomonas sp. Pc102]